MSDTGAGWHFSRRVLLKRVGGVGAAAVPAGILLPVISTPAGDAVAALALQATPAAPIREALETLTAAEAQMLEAITARLIPADDSGPGAAEARAARFIDRALGGALASSHEAYRSGLAAVDRYARTAKGAPFTRLSSQDQDAVLRDIEGNVATGFSPNASTFFSLVLAHTIQGTFSDPYYGGNANFVGWDLVGYPGVRLAVSAGQQRLDTRPAPTHMSAYDYTMFSGRKPARASRDLGGGHHGD
jgi:gluconate 2-dehydrogenase gamma chain